MTLAAFLGKFASSLPHGSLWALAIGLVAGVVASAVCPCTVPVGLGVAGVVGSSGGENRRNGFSIALAFFFGIVINLAILGVIAGRLGAVLPESFGRYWSLGMATASLRASVAPFWCPRIGIRRPASLRHPGLVRPFLYAFPFSLGTSPPPLL